VPAIRYAIPYLIGCPSGGLPTGGSFIMNAATSRFAQGFMLAEQKTLSKVQIFFTGTSGLLTVNDAYAELWGDSGAGQPGTLTEARNTLSTNAGLPAAGWNEWTGFTTVCSAFTQYYIVTRNANGTPATNNYTQRLLSSGAVLPDHNWSSLTRIGFTKWQSTDSGSTWTSGVFNAAAVRLEFSDGTFAGFPISQVTPNTTQTVYAAREYGGRFTWPAGAPGVYVRGAGLGFATNLGTPTFGPAFKLYRGASVPGTLLGTTGQLPPGPLDAAGAVQQVGSRFAAPILLSPGEVYRLTCATPGSTDGSANAWRFVESTVNNDAPSKALLGFDQARVYYDGTSWTEDDTAMPTSWFLLPDPDQPFVGNTPNRRRRRPGARTYFLPRVRPLIIPVAGVAAPAAVIIQTRKRKSQQPTPQGPRPVVNFVIPPAAAAAAPAPVISVPRRRSQPRRQTFRRQVFHVVVPAAAVNPPAVVLARRRRKVCRTVQVIRRPVRPVVAAAVAPAAVNVFPSRRRSYRTAPAIRRTVRPVINVSVAGAAGPVIVTRARKVR
jgi:hypothetical protein